MHAHTQPNNICTQHMQTHTHTHTRTDWKTIAQQEDGQNPRAQGGFLMTLLDFVSPTFLPVSLYFYLPSLLSGPQRGVF